MPKYISSPLLKSIVARLEALKKASNESTWNWDSIERKTMLSFESELADVMGVTSKNSITSLLSTLIGRLQNERRYLTNAEMVVINDIAKLINFKWEGQ